MGTIADERLLQTLRWMPESEAVEGQLYIISGGVGLKRDGQWFTLTGCETPGRPIQWKVSYCAPLAYEPEATDALDDYVPGRCEVCGWTLAETIEQGCVPGNCSYRPDERSAEGRRIRRRRVALKARRLVAEGVIPTETADIPSPKTVPSPSIGEG